MTQTRLSSLIEATANTLIGYVVAIIGQLCFFPVVGIHIPFTSNLKVGLFFTLLSLVRGYALRRWFNARLHAAAMRIGQGSRTATPQART